MRAITTVGDVENEFLKSMYHKTIDFSNEAMKNLVKIEQFDKYLTFTLINIQLANEFALKAAIISNYGIKFVIETKNDSDEDIVKNYLNNTLTVRNYDNLKNQFKSSGNLTKEYIKQMNKFQQYRNRIIHSIYDFSLEDISSIKRQTIYYYLTVVNLLKDSISVRSEMNDHLLHLVETLENSTINSLKKDTEYIDTIEKYLETNNWDGALICVHCDYPSVTDRGLCLLCLESFKTNSDIYGYANCDLCKSKDSVIFDNLNSDINFRMNGFCMICEEKVPLMYCDRCDLWHSEFSDC